MHTGKKYNNKNYLRKIRIVLTGPESTGKTSLSLALSNHYKVNLIPEFSRYFLTKSVVPYTFEEVSQMALQQIKLSENAPSHNSFHLEDTDLLTYLVWQGFKYGSVDPYLLENWKGHQADFYLMCVPDVKWQSDPLRENPLQRTEIANLFINYLTASQLDYGYVTGSGISRLNNAVFLIDQFIKKTTFAS
ncbi:MAG: ATP-binding protein [Saprospiraceae bacterium]|nr:ATP-binding protein [Candidatus Vicinibacter affinis]